MSATARPLSLLAEITYRCNLQCPYCYNPLDLKSFADELDAATWQRVIEEAAGLGVLQMHFSGGEPTLRRDDLPVMMRQARRFGIYTNLITQGTFLGEALLDALIDAGLDHVQISLQAAHAPLADPIAGAPVHAKKLEAIRRTVERNVAVTVNLVLHRANIDSIPDIIALTESLGVPRLELANTQYYGWGFLNRAALMPTREQVDRAKEIVAAAQARLRGRMAITHVLADYFEPFPKPCMNGWARQYLTITPDGRALPCPAAVAITSLKFENVRDKSLAEIWYESAAFNQYRGTAWMPQPCRSCPRREIDWGGCRCQAFLLTGDAGVTDPACSLSPHHGIVEATRDDIAETAWAPRRLSPV